MLKLLGERVRQRSGIFTRTTGDNDNTSCDETYHGVNFDSISEGGSTFDGEK